MSEDHIHTTCAVKESHVHTVIMELATAFLSDLVE